MVKAVPPLEHNDSILSYGTEDLAQYRDLPQATTRIVLGCAGAATTNPYIDTTAGYQEHTFVMRISHFSQIYSPTKLVLRSTKAQLDIGLDAVTKWCVLLYPNGNQPERAGFVSLYLYRWDKQIEPVAATFKFSLLNTAMEKSFVVDVAEKKMFGHSGGNSKSLGAPKFVSREDLLNSAWGLLNDDTLTVICELKVFQHSDCSTSSRSKKLGERSSQLLTSKRLRFHPEVEELHYAQSEEAEADKRRLKGDKMSVGLFNPIKFLNSIDQWRMDKFETEI